jgi:hypothetical protein
MDNILCDYLPLERVKDGYYFLEMLLLPKYIERDQFPPGRHNPLLVYSNYQPYNNSDYNDVFRVYHRS